MTTKAKRPKKSKSPARPTLARVLRALGACGSRAGDVDGAVQWAEPYGDDYERAWKECPRGDWLAWLLGRIAPDDRESPERRQLALIVARFARPLVAKHVPAGELRPMRCVEVVEAWGRGDPSVTIDDVRKARSDSWAYRAQVWDAYYAALNELRRGNLSASAASAARRRLRAADASARRGAAAKVSALRAKAAELRKTAEDLWAKWREVRESLLPKYRAQLADAVREVCPTPPEALTLAKAGVKDGSRG